jgi:hypothetical protein
MSTRAALAAVAALLAVLPALPAAAQPTPAYAYRLGNRTLRGVVVRFTPGAFGLGLLDDRGFVDNVALHPGTIILPIGLTLQPGMRVRVRGYAAGSAFDAERIDADVALAPRRPAAPPAWYALWDGTPDQPGYAPVNPPAPPAANPPAPP